MPRFNASLASELAKAGVKIAVMDIAENKAQEVVIEILNTGSEVITVGVDVLDLDSLAQARDNILQEFGQVDILITGAGENITAAITSPSLSFFDLPQDTLEWVVNLNLLGTIYATR